MYFPNGKYMPGLLRVKQALRSAADGLDGDGCPRAGGTVVTPIGRNHQRHRFSLEPVQVGFVRAAGREYA